MILTREQMWELLARHGETGELARIMIGGAYAESKWNAEANGDGGHSRGLWQMHDQGLGAGMTVEERCDPDIACAAMLPEYTKWHAYWDGKGYRGLDLAWRTCAWAEKPLDYEDPNSPAAAGYRDGYMIAGVPPTSGMPGEYYNPDYRTPAYQQKQDWTCSICATAQALSSIGYIIEPADLQDIMVSAGLVTPADGLLDGTGSALATWLHDTYALRVQQLWPATWSWIYERAGDGPILIGSDGWYHWVSVRRPMVGHDLSIANSADGYMGIHQTLSREQFGTLGIFAAIWIPIPQFIRQPTPPPSEPTEDPLAACISQVGYLQSTGTIIVHDVEKSISLLDSALGEKHVAKTARDFIEQAREALQHGALPAAKTVERGGPPEEG